MSWDNEKTNVVFHDYLHGGPEASDSREQWFDLCEEAGIDPESPEAYKAETENFHYYGYEIAIKCEADMDTGNVRLLGINGRDLEEPVKI